MSDYGRQLQEKQKVQLLYGLKNNQVRLMFKKHSSSEIFSILERRLDRVVYYLGFAGSPRVARQMISHGHILVNGRKVTIPSYGVTIGDTIAIRQESRQRKLFEGIAERLKQKETPPWLKLNHEKLEGECLAIPDATGIQLPFDISLVGEFYSR